MANSTEGRKNDSGKLRYDLVPPDALEAWVDVLTAGARKYDDRNWEKGMDYGRNFAATNRHIWAWWNGETVAPDDKQHHLAHAICCLSFLLAYELRGMTEFDDRPNSPYRRLGWKARIVRLFRRENETAGCGCKVLDDESLKEGDA